MGNIGRRRREAKPVGSNEGKDAWSQARGAAAAQRSTTETPTQRTTEPLKQQLSKE